MFLSVITQLDLTLSSFIHFFPPLSPIELEDSDQTTLLYCQTHPRPILTSLRLSVLLQVPHRGIKAFYVLYHMSVNF